MHSNMTGNFAPAANNANDGREGAKPAWELISICNDHLRPNSGRWRAVELKKRSADKSGRSLQPLQENETQAFSKIPLMFEVSKEKYPAGDDAAFLRLALRRPAPLLTPQAARWQLWYRGRLGCGAISWHRSADALFSHRLQFTPQVNIWRVNGR